MQNFTSGKKPKLYVAIDFVFILICMCLKLAMHKEIKHVEIFLSLFSMFVCIVLGFVHTWAAHLILPRPPIAFLVQFLLRYSLLFYFFISIIIVITDCWCWCAFVAVAVVVLPKDTFSVMFRQFAPTTT